MTSLLKPPASLVLGATGAGKTYSIPTYLEAGKKVFVLVTEPTGVESLVDSVSDRKLPLENLHYKLCKPAADGLDTLIRQAQISNTKSAADMQKMDIGLDKKNYPQYIQFLEACQNFVCDRTGEEFGDITEWKDDRAFIIDSLSGLNYMVTRNQCGNRVTMTQPEFGICQNIIEGLLNTMTGLDCFFTLVAHPEYERDELTSKMWIMSSTLGKKLAPKIPRFFSEVIWAEKADKKFLWSTDRSDVNVKSRVLPISDTLSPSFVDIVNGYNLRKQTMEEFSKTHNEAEAV